MKTTEKSFGFVPDTICCPMDPVLIDRMLMSSSGSNMKVRIHLKPVLTTSNYLTTCLPAFLPACVPTYQNIAIENIHAENILFIFDWLPRQCPEMPNDIFLSF